MLERALKDNWMVFIASLIDVSTSYTGNSENDIVNQCFPTAGSNKRFIGPHRRFSRLRVEQQSPAQRESHDWQVFRL